MCHRCLTFDEDYHHHGVDTFRAMAMVMLLRYYNGGKVLFATYIISKTCAQVTKNQLSEALAVPQGFKHSASSGAVLLAECV